MSALCVSKQNCTPSTGQVSAIQNGETERCSKPRAVFAHTLAFSQVLTTTVYYNDSKSSGAFAPTDRRRIQTLLELNPSNVKAIYVCLISISCSRDSADGHSTSLPFAVQ